MIQIIHTVRNLDHQTGGVPVAIIQLLRTLALSNPDLRLTLISHVGQNPLLKNNWLNHNLTWQSLPNDSSRSFQLSLRKLATARNKDVPLLIHDHGLWLPNNHGVAVSSRYFDLPRLISIHGMLEPWAWKEKKCKKRVAWKIFQYYDLKTAQVLHSTSHSEALNLTRIFPFRIPIAVVPLGVDIPSLPPRISLSSSPKTVLFLSRIHRKKGLLNLVRAWAALNPQDWKLMIVGSDQDGHLAEVEKHVNHLKINNSIEFRDAVEGQEKWQLFQFADLFVLPSFSENFGIVVAEALAAGTPVITTRETPWSDLETYHCGWWIPVGVAPLVEALKQAMMLSDHERIEMGKRGQELISAHYSWKQSAEQMLKVYRWISGQDKMPDCIHFY